MTNEFLYGLIGGSVGTIVSHPFDTIKTRLQSNNSKTIIEALKKGNLYSGLHAPLLGIMLEKSIVFGFYEKSKEIIKNDFVNGLIAGFMSTVIVTPIDKIKINFQNNQLKINNIENMKILFNPKNLYRGFIPTIFRETPGFGIYFSTYNYLNNNYNYEKNFFKNFTFGALSGLNAWIFIYPADLIKTKLQSSVEKQNVLHVIKNVWGNNSSISTGFKNFYKGFNLAIMRAMPLHGGVFLGYELSKEYMKAT